MFSSIAKVGSYACVICCIANFTVLKSAEASPVGPTQQTTYIHGAVLGNIYEGPFPLPGNSTQLTGLTSVPLVGVQVTATFGSNVKSTFTDAASEFSLSVPKINNLQITESTTPGTPTADNITVTGGNGISLTASTVTNPTIPYSLIEVNPLDNSASSEEAKTATLNAFYYVNQAREYISGVLGLDTPIQLYTDRLRVIANSTQVLCSGGYLKADQNNSARLLFAKRRSEGGVQCGNAATQSFVFHEYMHHVHTITGLVDSAPTNSALKEGWGDLFACFASRNPDLFSGIGTNEGVPIPGRSCVNTYQYGTGGEAHEVGQAWSGAGWQFRLRLIKRYSQLGQGSETGIRVAERVVFRALLNNPQTIPAAIRALVRSDDDDNGEYRDGTAHIDDIIYAAAQHNLCSAFGAFPDIAGWPAETWQAQCDAIVVG